MTIGTVALIVADAMGSYPDLGLMAGSCPTESTRRSLVTTNVLVNELEFRLSLQGSDRLIEGLVSSNQNRVTLPREEVASAMTYLSECTIIIIFVCRYFVAHGERLRRARPCLCLIFGNFWANLRRVILPCDFAILNSITGSSTDCHFTSFDCMTNRVNWWLASDLPLPSKTIPTRPTTILYWSMEVHPIVTVSHVALAFLCDSRIPQPFRACCR